MKLVYVFLALVLTAATSARGAGSGAKTRGAKPAKMTTAPESKKEAQGSNKGVDGPTSSESRDLPLGKVRVVPLYPKDKNAEKRCAIQVHLGEDAFRAFNMNDLIALSKVEGGVVNLNRVKPNITPDVLKNTIALNTNPLVPVPLEGRVAKGECTGNDAPMQLMAEKINSYYKDHPTSENLVDSVANNMSGGDPPFDPSAGWSQTVQAPAKSLQVDTAVQATSGSTETIGGKSR